MKSNGKESQTLADHDAITSANADANARSNTNGSIIENTGASAKSRIHMQLRMQTGVRLTGKQVETFDACNACDCESI